MKKALKLIPFLVLIIATSCAVQKSESNIKEVVFDAQTRGRSENITLVSNSLTFKTQKEAKTFSINKVQREELETVISKIKVKGISDLKAPSDKRTYDGAMNATITLKIGDKTYVSSSFDDDNPPAELKPIVSLLRGFVR